MKGGEEKKKREGNGREGRGKGREERKEIKKKNTYFWLSGGMGSSS